MVISERIRRVGKVAAMVWFGLFVFTTVFYVSLPFDRFKDLVAQRLASAGYEMEVKHAGPSLGLGMALDEITLVSHPAGAAKPSRILVEQATLGYSVLSSLLGTKSYSISADVFKGEIDAKVKVGKVDASAEVRAAEIDLSDIPWVKSAINLPMFGKIDVKFDIDLPKQRVSEAKGVLSWSCSACVLGDGKAKLTIANNPMLADGLGLPKIHLGDFDGKIAIDKGVGRLQNVQFKSKDVEATIDGEIHLAQPIATSHVDIYVKFKLSDSLLRSSEKLRTIMDLTTQLGKRTDGFLGFRANGTFQNMGNVQWLKVSPFLSTALPGKPIPPARVPVAPHPRPVAPPPLPVAPPPPVAPAPPPPVPAPAPAPAPPPAPVVAVPAAPAPPPAAAPPPAPTPPPSSAPSPAPAAYQPIAPAIPQPPAPPGAPATATATATSTAPASTTPPGATGAVPAQPHAAVPPGTAPAPSTAPAAPGAPAPPAATPGMSDEL